MVQWNPTEPFVVARVSRWLKGVQDVPNGSLDWSKYDLTGPMDFYMGPSKFSARPKWV